MTRYIDLSLNIENDMPVHPYDDDVNLYQDKNLEDDEYNNFRIEAGMHTGTHIDTPMHLIKSSTFITEIPLERFIGNGCLIDVRDQPVINYKEEYSNIVNDGDIVLLFTSHSDKYGSGEYFVDHPVIDEELADFFIEKEIKMLGMDLPSPDKYPFKIHKKLFEGNILIIENMRNLSELLHINNFEIIALPLKIRAEASLARVIARY